MARGFVLLFVLSLLPSCVSYRARPLEPEKTAREFESRSLADPALRSFIEAQSGLTLAAWPPQPWDADSLALAAFYFQPDLDAARAHRAAADAGRRTAAERPNPALVGGPFEHVTNTSGLPWIWGVSLDFQIETAGKRGALRLKAAAAAEQARLELAQAAWGARSRVRAAAVDLWAAREAEAVLRHQQSDLAENERLLVGRARAGETSPLNSTQAVLLADKSMLALADAHRRRVDASGALAAALGVPVAAARTVALSTASFAAAPNPKAPAVEGARAEALKTRPDLLASLAAYAAAEADLRLEVARQYPDLHIGPGYTYDQGADKWGFSFNLPIPLFNRNRGPIAEADGRRREAAARFLGLQAKIIDDIDRATESYEAAYDKLGSADAALERHLEQDAVIRRLLRPGDVTRMTLFRFQLDLDTTRLARAQALAEAQQALGALEDALERPLAGGALPPAAYEKEPR
jgi:cobalt-zinc-cadmium efflux system outer membrane protein